MENLGTLYIEINHDYYDIEINSISLRIIDNDVGELKVYYSSEDNINVYGRATFIA